MSDTCSSWDPCGDPLPDQPVERQPSRVSFTFRHRPRTKFLITHDVVPIQIVHNIHEDKHREEAQVDLAQKSLLGLLALLGGQSSNVGRSFQFHNPDGLGVSSHDLDVVGLGLVVGILHLDILDRHGTGGRVVRGAGREEWVGEWEGDGRTRALSYTKI